MLTDAVKQNHYMSWQLCGRSSVLSGFSDKRFLLSAVFFRIAIMSFIYVSFILDTPRGGAARCVVVIVIIYIFFSLLFIEISQFRSRLGNNCMREVLKIRAFIRYECFLNFIWLARW